MQENERYFQTTDLGHNVLLKEADPLAVALVINILGLEVYREVRVHSAAVGSSDSVAIFKETYPEIFKSLLIKALVNASGSYLFVAAVLEIAKKPNGTTDLKDSAAVLSQLFALFGGNASLLISQGNPTALFKQYFVGIPVQTEILPDLQEYEDPRVVAGLKQSKYE